jgi:hypothetical protein
MRERPHINHERECLSATRQDIQPRTRLLAHTAKVLSRRRPFRMRTRVAHGGPARAAHLPGARGRRSPMISTPLRDCLAASASAPSAARSASLP